MGHQILQERHSDRATHSHMCRYSGETEASCTLTGALRTEGHGANEVSAAGGVDVTKSWKPLIYQVLHVVHHRAEESMRERGKPKRRGQPLFQEVSITPSRNFSKVALHSLGPDHCSGYNNVQHIGLVLHGLHKEEGLLKVEKIQQKI